MARDTSTEDAGALPLSALKGQSLRAGCAGGLSERTYLPGPAIAHGRRECLEELDSLKRYYERKGMTVQAATIKAAIRKLRKC